MILRNGNRLSLACNTCDEIYDAPEGDEFQLVWHDAKTDGWRARKITDEWGDEWVHKCPRCGV